MVRGFCDTDVRHVVFVSVALKRNQRPGQPFAVFLQLSTGTAIRSAPVAAH
jgi:hypothetical protein